MGKENCRIKADVEGRIGQGIGQVGRLRIRWPQRPTEDRNSAYLSCCHILGSKGTRRTHNYPLQLYSRDMTTRWIGSAGTLNAVAHGRTIVGHVVVRWRNTNTSDKASGRVGALGYRVRVTASAWSDTRPNASKVTDQITGLTSPRPTTLGFRFLRVFQGPSFYALSLVMPAITLAAALGSCIPMVRSLPTVNILMSLASAWYAFLIMPLLDVLLGNEPQDDVRDWSSTDTRWGRWILYTYTCAHYIVLG